MRVLGKENIPAWIIKNSSGRRWDSNRGDVIREEPPAGRKERGRGMKKDMKSGTSEKWE